MKDELKNNLNQIVKDAGNVPGVEVVTAYDDRLEVVFEPDHQRTGSELLELQQILFNYKIFSFIKMEKVELWSGILKQINFTIL